MASRRISGCEFALAPSFLLAGILLFVPLVTAAAQEEGAAIDARIRPGIGEPLLVSIDVRGEGSGRIVVAGNEQVLPYDATARVRYVDELLDPGDDLVRANRRYELWSETDAGAIVDPGYEGLEMEFTIDRSDVPSFGCADGRLIAASHTELLLAQAAGVCAWVGLPEAIAVGETCTPSIRGLIATISMPEGDLEVEPCTLTCDRIDSEKKRAFFSGDVRWIETMDDDFVVIAKSQGRLELEVDYDSSRLAVARVKGTARATSDTPGIEVDASVEFEAELTTETGPAAAKSLRSKPRFRDVTHPIENLGLTITLPSSWINAGNESNIQTFLRGVSSEAGAARLSVFAIASAEPIDDVRRETEAQLEQNPQTFKVSSAKHRRFGKGFAISTVDAQGQSIATEYFRMNEQLIVVIQHSGSPDATKKTSKEVKEASASLQNAS